MQIHGPAHVHGAQPINAPSTAASAGRTEATSFGAVRDELHISDAGSFVDQARDLPDIRTEKVQQLRTAIANGTYDIGAKLDLAVSRLLDEIG